MRIALNCLLLATLLSVTTVSAQTTEVPENFAYTEIDTEYGAGDIATRCTVSRVSVSGRKRRFDSYDGGNMLYDMDHGLLMSVNHKAKTYYNEKLEIGIYDRFKELTFTDGGAKPKPLPGTTSINFQNAKGYRSITTNPADGWTTTLTYWISTASNNVIQVHCSRSAPNGISRLESIRTQFDYDSKLNEDIFSTDPPQGYAEQVAPKVTSVRTMQ